MRDVSGDQDCAGLKTDTRLHRVAKVNRRTVSAQLTKQLPCPQAGFRVSASDGAASRAWTGRGFSR